MFQPFAIMSVDLEDWFQVENLRRACTLEKWGNFDLRINYGLEKLLYLFEKKNISATFYVVGCIAEKCPQTVTKIAEKGHELAIHGYYHKLLHELTEDEFKNDTLRCKNLVEDLSGNTAQGFRAPAFSITDSALDALAEMGFKYDSSFISSEMNSRFGKLSNESIAGRGNVPWKVRDNLWELPMVTLPLAGRRIPWGGGGYFRLFPYYLFKKGIEKIREETGYYHFFIHPWELDPEQPRVKDVPLMNRFRHYVNLDKTGEKLERLLEDFEFISTSEAIRILENNEKKVTS